MIDEEKKNVFSQQIRERVSVSHESVFQNAFFSQLEPLTVPRCCFSLFGIFYSIDLGCSLVFSIMQPERRFRFFRVFRRAAGALRREDARTREDARRGRRFLLCIVLPLCITENWTSLETSAEPCKATFPLSAE